MNLVNYFPNRKKRKTKEHLDRFYKKCTCGNFEYCSYQMFKHPDVLDNALACNIIRDKSRLITNKVRGVQTIDEDEIKEKLRIHKAANEHLKDMHKPRGWIEKLLLALVGGSGKGGIGGGLGGGDFF